MEPSVAYRIQTFDTALHIAVFPVPGGDAYEKENISFVHLGVEQDAEAMRERELADNPVVKFNCRNPSQMTTFNIKWDVGPTGETVIVWVEDHIGAEYRGSRAEFPFSRLGVRVVGE